MDAAALTAAIGAEFEHKAREAFALRDWLSDVPNLGELPAGILLASGYAASTADDAGALLQACAEAIGAGADVRLRHDARGRLVPDRSAQNGGDGAPRALIAVDGTGDAAVNAPGTLRMTCFPPGRGPYDRWELTAEATGEVLASGTDFPLDRPPARDAIEAAIAEYRSREASG